MAKDRSLLIAIIGIVLISLIVPVILSSSGTPESKAATQVEAGNVAGEAGLVIEDCYDLHGASYMNEATCRRFCTTNGLRFFAYSTRSQYCCCGKTALN